MPVDKLPHLKHMFLVGEDIEEKGKSIDFNKHLNEASEHFDIEWVEREDGIVLHYTSGLQETQRYSSCSISDGPTIIKQHDGCLI